MITATALAGGVESYLERYQAAIIRTLTRELMARDVELLRRLAG